MKFLCGITFVKVRSKFGLHKEGMSHLVRNSILAGILGIVECCLLGRHNIDQLTCLAALKRENRFFLNFFCCVL